MQNKLCLQTLGSFFDIEDPNISIPEKTSVKSVCIRSKTLPVQLILSPTKQAS